MDGSHLRLRNASIINGINVIQMPQIMGIKAGMTGSWENSRKGSDQSEKAHPSASKKRMLLLTHANPHPFRNLFNHNAMSNSVINSGSKITSTLSMTCSEVSSTIKSTSPKTLQEEQCTKHSSVLCSIIVGMHLLTGSSRISMPLMELIISTSRSLFLLTRVRLTIVSHSLVL